MKVVVVIGKGVGCPPEVAELAARAGHAVATAGAVLVTGGLGGVMRAAAHAAVAQGGQVVGLVPQGRETDVFKADGVIVLRTGLPVAYRNALTASVADVGIVLPGSHGTGQEGMALAERGIPLLGLGDHAGYPSAILADEWQTVGEGLLSPMLAHALSREGRRRSVSG